MQHPRIERCSYCFSMTCLYSLSQNVRGSPEHCFISSIRNNIKLIKLYKATQSQRGRHCNFARWRSVKSEAIHSMLRTLSSRTTVHWHSSLCPLSLYAHQVLQGFMFGIGTTVTTLRQQLYTTAAVTTARDHRYMYCLRSLTVF